MLMASLKEVTVHFALRTIVFKDNRRQGRVSMTRPA